MASPPDTPDRRVRVLPDSLVNKIAAGEVVERPASVVKELVENAVDAGASEIRVDLRGGGKSLVAVRDDGRGMTRDDVLLAIERHATSKIRQPEDLFAIHTLGFRGEALPSIAQVSRMEIKTAVRGEDVGTQVLIDGGVLKTVRDAPPVAGTEILVRRLFFNTPVRLRFLKTERTELGHATEAVVRLALANPHVRFDLFRASAKGPTRVIQAPATDDLGRRAADLLGRDVRDRLLAVQAESGGMALQGLAGTPSLNRSTRNATYLFVNGRPVRDRLLLSAVSEAYRGMVPRGRFPLVVLFLQLPTEEVDHNVHPTKSEVRFVRGNHVHRFVVETLSDSLRRTRSAAPPPPAGSAVAAIAGTPMQLPDLEPVSHTGRGTPSWSAVRDSLFDGVADAPGEAAVAEDPGDGVSPPPAETSVRYSDMVYLGQYEGTYLLLQSGHDLAVVDQHAAHERINYERILHAQQRGFSSQALLVPEVLDLPRGQSAVLLDRAEMLAGLGIELSDFGGGSIAVSALPPNLSAGAVRTLVTDVAQELMSARRSTAIEDLRHTIAALAACHGSVRAHQRLSLEEVRSLLTQLDQADHPYTCPHGRPLITRFSLRDVEKWFDRT